MTWKRSTYCGSASCVEWRRSTYCGTSACVEVVKTNSVSVRDGKDRTGPVLTFEPGDWAAFIAWCVR
jgi:hypothetical protein